MAYVNVAEWKPEQVTEWLKGLDSTVLQYIHSFLRNEVNGQQLLNLRPDDLNHLGVQKLGHQELILEAVEHLRNFHYELDRENLQLLALRLACRARSLHNELKQRSDLQPLSTQTLADVAHVIMAVKPLVCWLDRSPFSGQFNYQEYKDDLLHLSLQIATCAQRDRFAEKPVEEIRSSCKKLAELGDEIIQDIADPLILQPASLGLVTLKKRASDDLGFFILPSFHGVHQIAEINFSSPAHQCGKIENGDEIVQVNYQTVVGWQTKKVMALFEESPTEVFLTLKKCPQHTKVYGQIYMKPYRLPSKKRSAPYSRWNDNLPSPRPELLTIPDFEIPLPKGVPKKVIPQSHSQFDCKSALSALTTEEKKEEDKEVKFDGKCEEDEDDDDDDDDSFMPETADEGQPSPMSMRLYLPKPRVTVQRRATVTGASPTSKRPPVNIEQFWAELRLERHWRDIGVTENTDKGKTDLFHLRDKSASVGNGLSFNFLRPCTTIGIETVVSQLKCAQQHEDITSEKKLQKCKDSVQIIAMEAHIIPDQCTLNSHSNTSHLNSEVNATGSVCSSETNVLSEKNKIRSGVRNDMETSVSHDHSVGPTSLEVFGDKDCEGKESFEISVPDFSVINFPVLDQFISRTDCSSEVVIKENILETNRTLDRENEHTLPRNVLVESNENVNVSAIGEELCNQATQSGKERGKLDKSYSTPAYDLLDSITFLEKKNSVCEDSVSEKLANGEVETKTVVVNYCTLQTHLDRSSFHCMQNIQNARSTLFSGDGFVNGDSRECGNGTSLVDKLDLCPIVVSEPKNLLSFSEGMINSCTGSSLGCSSLDNQPSTPIRPVGGELNEQLHVNPFDTNMCSDKKEPVILSDSQYNFHVNNYSEKSWNIQSSENPCILLPDVEADKTLFSDKRVSEVSSQPSSILGTSENSIDKTCKVKINPMLSAKCDASKWPVKIIANHSTARNNFCTKSIFPNTTTKSFSAAFFSSPQSTRKRNAILSKRRKVCVKDIGCGECEGWLLHRFRSSGAGATWLKMWFILKDITCYGFKSPQASKAHIMIVLPGFTVCIAEEVKSRSFAFKIYHTGTVFYLAAETAEELNVWLECLSVAAISQKLVKTPAGFNLQDVYFSETDEESDSQKDSDPETSIPKSGSCKFDSFVDNSSQQLWKVRQNSVTESKKTDNPKLFGSLKKIVSKNENIGPTMQMDLPEPASSSLDRKYLHHFLGGIRNSNVPVPTAQFRSYRRAPKKCPGKESKLDEGKSDQISDNIWPSSRNDNSLKNSKHPVNHFEVSSSTNILLESRIPNEKAIASGSNKVVLNKTDHCNHKSQDRRFSSSNKLTTSTLAHNNALALQKVDSSLETNAIYNPNRKCSNLKDKTQHQPSSISQILGGGRKVHPKEEGPKIKLAFEMQLGESKFSASPNKDTYSKPSKLRNLFLFTRNQNVKYSYDEATLSSGESCKALLGSPRLNRACLWEKQMCCSKNAPRQLNYLNPVTYPSSSVTPPRRTAYYPDSQSDCNIPHVKPMMGVAMISKKPCKVVSSASSISQSCSTPDYPDLEYPPVFEPETYTLSNASTLLKSRHHDSCTNCKVCACSSVENKQTKT